MRVDQASRLRELVCKERPAGRLITITSGKGGVGKSNMVLNLGLTLVHQGHRVLIVDADLGLANIEILLGLSCPYTLEHVLDGAKPIEDIIVETASGLKVIPGSSGVPKIADLNQYKRDCFIESFQRLQHHADFILVDTAAGMGRNVVNFALAADEVLLVTTPEPSAIVDAYAMIKTIVQRSRDTVLKLVVNMVRSEDQGRTVCEKIQEATLRFLNRPIEMLGTVVKDEHVPQAVMRSQPFVLLYPKAPASRMVARIAEQLGNNHSEALKPTQHGSMFRRLVAAFGGSG